MTSADQTSTQTSAQAFAAAADLLEQGQMVNRLSTALTAIAAAVLLLPIFPGSEGLVPVTVLAAVAGLVQLALAMRAGFKAALYRRLAAEARDGSAAILSATTAPPSPAGNKARRSPAGRSLGAKRLLLAQGAALLAQVALAIAGGVYTLMQTR